MEPDVLVLMGGKLKIPQKSIKKLEGKEFVRVKGCRVLSEN